VTEPAASERTALDLVIALHRLTRSLRQAGAAPTVAPTQLVVLAALRMNGPSRISEIAAQVPCSQPTATSVVAALDERGLVHRAPDPEDGRAVRVELSAAGAEVLSSVAHGEAGELARRLARLPAADAALVVSAIDVLTELSRPS
jgi:DNA-binding MarR family transcriptional regulator